MNEYCNDIQRTKQGQAVFTFVQAAAGSVTTVGTGTLPTGRGKIIAVDVVAASNTNADVDGVTFTLSANGKEIFTSEAAIKYSPLMNGKRTIQSQPIAEGSTINWSIINDQAVVITFYFQFIFE